MIREKRDSRLTADISETAHDLLKAAVIKFDSSKGKLLERMIKNFCAETPEHEKPSRGIIVETSIDKPKSVKRFVPPSILEVQTYMLERGVHISKDSKDEAEKFCDHFESNGWKVGGKTKMVSWKAAVRNWLKGNSNGQNNGNAKGASQKKSAYERAREANSEYRQSDEREMAMGTDGRHLGRTVDEGKRGRTIEHVDSPAFIDYE